MNSLDIDIFIMHLIVNSSLARWESCRSTSKYWVLAFVRYEHWTCLFSEFYLLFLISIVTNYLVAAVL